MDLFSLFLFTHENNEIKSPTKIYDFTVDMNAICINHSWISYFYDTHYIDYK